MRSQLTHEDAANRAYRENVPGWYVVQPRTDLAVAGPYSGEKNARVEAARRDAAWRHVDPNLLVVVHLVRADRPAGYPWTRDAEDSR